jgi:hypothetical protein
MEYKLSGECYLYLTQSESVEKFYSLVEEGTLWDYISRLFEDSVQKDTLVNRIDEMERNILDKIQSSSSAVFTPVVMSASRETGKAVGQNSTSSVVSVDIAPALSMGGTKGNVKNAMLRIGSMGRK